MAFSSSTLTGAFKRLSVAAAAFLLTLQAAISPSLAEGRSLIRDAEIENTLRVMSNPIFEKAGLNPSSVKMFIINDNSINAFVAGGSNVFLHTGLILATKNPGMLIGVVAHETGHIAGGHLAQGAEKVQHAQIGTIMSYVLGAAAMAAGSSDAGAAIMSGGQEVAQRAFFSYTRMNEQAADSAAMSYLDQLGISSTGFLQILQTLKRQEDRHFGRIDPYAMTHPLSRDRLATIRRHLMNTEIPSDAVPAEYLPMYGRMMAKLEGFLLDTRQVLMRYPVSNHSLEARYARAVAYYRSAELEKSLAEIDSLITEKPDDAFFHELKGQILYENGKIQPALASYKKAVSLMPNSPLILTALAQTELTDGSPELLKQAVANLEKSTMLDNADASTWRLLAGAYGRSGKLGMSYLALAEEALLTNKPKDALRQAQLALKELKTGSPAHLRASDLIMIAQKQVDDDKDL